MWAHVDVSQGTMLPKRNKRNLVILWVRGHRLTCVGGKKKLFSSEMFMKSLGREIHHCREGNLSPAWDSDWHLPAHKETFLALAHWICQAVCRPLFIWADNCSWLFCSWADDYKLHSEMISISAVKWEWCVTQSGEQTTSSNGENILYPGHHCCCFSMNTAVSTFSLICQWQIFPYETQPLPPKKKPMRKKPPQNLLLHNRK